MAADLHIHVLTKDFTEKDYAKFQGNTMGSKFFDPLSSADDSPDLFDKCVNTPNILVGQVSFLKAMIFEDTETFVPSTIGEISEIIGEDFHVIDDGLIGKIEESFNLANNTGYSLNEKGDVIHFLNQRKGEKVFTINW